MAIIHVTKLKDLRRQLVSYSWHVPCVLSALEFSVDNLGCFDYKKLSPNESKLLEAVMRPLDSREQYNFSQSAGSVLKTIVIQRFDSAIVMAAKEARAEAQSVLDVLEGV